MQLAVGDEVAVAFELQPHLALHAGGRDFREALNPNSKRVVQAYVEPSLAGVEREVRLQFERHGYFVADRKLHAPGAPVFNRITTLKDSWAK